MRTGPYAAAVGLSLALTAGCSGGAAEPKQRSSEHVKLSDEPDRVKLLAHRAVEQFENAVQKKGHASLWVYAGMCAVIESPWRPAGVHRNLYDLVPNPGVVHVKDAATGEVVTQAVAWDKQAGKFVTGIIAVLDPSGKDAATPIQTEYEQFNIGAEHSTLDSATVAFSQKFKQIIETDQGFLVMDAVATGEDKSAKAFAGRPEIKNLCEQAVTNPPTEPIAPRV